MFQHVDAYAGDPILSLMESFKTDPRQDKVNLSIGLYYDEQGIIPQLAAVVRLEEPLPLVGHPAGEAVIMALTPRRLMAHVSGTTAAQVETVLLS